MTKVYSLSIRSNVNIYFIEAQEQKKRFIKIYNNININLESIVIKIFIFVIKKVKYDSILKCFYERKTRLEFNYATNKSCKIMSINDKDKITFKIIVDKNKRNKIKVSMFS